MRNLGYRDSVYFSQFTVHCLPFTDLQRPLELLTQGVELDAFADAATGRAPYPIATREMLDVVAAFEAIIRSMDTGRPVSIN